MDEKIPIPINIKIGNYNLLLKYENEKLNFTKNFSNLAPIPFHKDMKMNDLVGELFSKIDKHYSLIGPAMTKKRKQEEFLQKKKEKCKDIMDKFNALNLKATGPLGEQIKLWNDETMIMVESCKAYKAHNVRFMKDIRDEKLFLTLESKKMELLEPLVEEGLTNRTFEIDMCEDNCITFKERLIGYPLQHILESLENEPDQEYLKNLIIKISEVIQHFHKIMEEHKRYYGHGNLNPISIVITVDKNEDDTEKCENCLKPLEPNWKFCANCGFPISVQKREERRKERQKGKIELKKNSQIKLIDFEFENNATFGHDWSQFFKIIKEHFVKNVNNYERGFIHEMLNYILQLSKKETTTYVPVKFEDFETSPSNNDLSCEGVINTFNKTKLFSQGRDGTIKLWRPNILIRIESCKQFNEYNYERDPDAFLDLWKERIEIMDILSENGMGPKIYEVSKCGDNCITFMEKIEGTTLYERINKLSFRPDSDNLIKNLLMKVIIAILKFHSLMLENGYSFGHGDLHMKNIMVTNNITIKELQKPPDVYLDDKEIKFIDFNFADKVSFDSDFDYFFKYLVLWNHLDTRLITYLKKYLDRIRDFL